jgi:integrase
MPRIRVTKGAIDALPTPTSDVIYWDTGFPGFGVKITPKGRKVFVVLYRTGGAGSKLRKYTIGPYGRVTLQRRGAPAAANKALKSIKTFLSWCVGRAILDQSPAEGIPLPTKEVARDRILDDRELADVILAARKMGGPYGGIVDLLALTGQRREEVAQMTWDELDLSQRNWVIPKSRTKNKKAHIVHLSDQALAVLKRQNRPGALVFSLLGQKPFQEFSKAKRELDRLSGVTGWRIHDLRRTCVSGMARLGIAPHVADKILNHQSGTISGVAAVYQRHEFLAERKQALDRWGAHVASILAKAASELGKLRTVA